MGQGSDQSHRLAPAERSELLRLVRAGETYQAAARVVGCSSKSVQRLLAKTGGIKPRTTPWSALRLSPSEREEISHAAVTASADTVGIAFEGLEPGQYAVSSYQDENSNGRLDTGFMGRPKEPYGISNDARRRFGPPAFPDASFLVGSEDTTISFRLK